MQKVDRRFIFLLIGLSVALALVLGHLFGVQPPIPVTPEAENIFREIDRLPPGTKILVSFDYGPSTAPEITPMAMGILRHAFRKDLRVVATALWPDGVKMAQRVLEQVAAQEYGKEYGIDYVNLGYKAGGIVVILGMGRNFRATFPNDAYGESIDDLEIMNGVDNFDAFPFIFDLSAGDPGIPYWVQIAADRFRKKLAGGCTAVSAPQFYPYYQAGQLVGLLGGMQGAAQYETLADASGAATAGMLAQSAAHAVIIIFIIIGNVAFFASGRGRRQGG
jgi:hypothetical protein